MNELCESIINSIDQDTNKLDQLDQKIDLLIDRQLREFSFLGILFVAITTLVTNMWAQYIYNNMITNYGHGTHYGTDSPLMLSVFTLIGIGVAILYVIDRVTHLL